MNIRDLGWRLDELTPAIEQEPVTSLVETPIAIQKKWSPREENILRLLTDGHSQEVVASVIGVDPSAISQYLSKDDFREELAARKTLTLDRYKKLDDGYDSLEQKLLERLDQSAFMLSKPGEIAAVLTRVNNAKRRLHDPSTVQNTPVSQVVNITMPVTVVHQFIKTIEGHVVGIDGNSLVTIQPRNLDGLVTKHLKQNTSIDNLPTTLLPP